MPYLETRTCSRCGATAPQVQLGLLVSEPGGWTTLTITGLPMVNRRLCPSCARDVRTLVDAGPAVLAAAHEADLTRAFRNGYEDGCTDTERSHVCVCPDGWYVQHETKQLLWMSTIGLADEPVSPLSEFIENHRAGVGPLLAAEAIADA